MTYYSQPQPETPARRQQGQVCRLQKTISAVLVAAGSSTRMGFDKLSFDLGGETVLHRSIGSSIKQRLEEIYKEYGRYLNKVDSFEFPGLTGMEKMASIMQKLRDNPPTELAGHKVVKVTDYKKPEETGLPAANVLIYALENGATVVVRPSGTEPKIKTYFTTLGKDLAEAQAQKDALAAAIEPILA